MEQEIPNTGNNQQRHTLFTHQRSINKNCLIKMAIGFRDVLNEWDNL